MNSFLSFLLFYLLHLTNNRLVLSQTLAQHNCGSGTNGYVIPDPEQCDRYALCYPNGEKKVTLCPDGFAFSLSEGRCDYLHKIDCSRRPKLQEPLSTPDCERANGFFPYHEGEGKCTQFKDCRSGVVFNNVCAAGTIFESAAAGCVHPGNTLRSECNSHLNLGIDCHNSLVNNPVDIVWFGTQTRQPHPSDCSKYFICLWNKVSRMGSCSKPNVYNPKSGLCEDYTIVEGCKDFYAEQ